MRINQSPTETGFNDFPVDMTYLPAIKNRVNLARKIDKEMHQKRKERTNDDWFRKAAEEMDIVLDESLLTDEKNRKEKTAADKRKEAELAKVGLCVRASVRVCVCVRVRCGAVLCSTRVC